MFVPYAFLPYLGIPVSATFSGKLDALVRALLIFRPTFVNQLLSRGSPPLENYQPEILIP